MPLVREKRGKKKTSYLTNKNICCPKRKKVADTHLDVDWDAEGVGSGFDRVCINLQHAVALQIAVKRGVRQAHVKYGNCVLRFANVTSLEQPLKPGIFAPKSRKSLGTVNSTMLSCTRSETPTN